MVHPCMKQFAFLLSVARHAVQTSIDVLFRRESFPMTQRLLRLAQGLGVRQGTFHHVRKLELIPAGTSSLLRPE